MTVQTENLKSQKNYDVLDEKLQANILREKIAGQNAVIVKCENILRE